MWAQTLVSPRTFRFGEAPSLEGGELAPGEALVRFGAGSICGSDLPYFCGELDPAQHHFGVPGCPLHEIVGTVVATTDGAGARVGERVVGWAKRLRGLAELAVADTDKIVPVTLDVSDVSATMLQPLACVLYAVARLSSVGVDGKRVAVIGQGTLGVLFGHVLKAAGAAEVIGIDEVDRSATAPSFGVDTPVWSSSLTWSRTIPAEEQPEIVVEAVGHQAATFADAIEAVAMGGTILAFGVPTATHYAVPFNRLFRKNLSVIAGTTRDYRDWLVEAQRYLDRFPKLAEHYLTHEFPVSQAQAAYDLAAVPAPGRLKVALREETS